MSNSGEKRLGGRADHLNSFKSTVTPRKNAPDSEFQPTQSTAYSQRLRPRPTKQTDRFKTAVPIKQEFRSPRKSISKPKTSKQQQSEQSSTTASRTAEKRKASKVDPQTIPSKVPKKKALAKRSSQVDSLVPRAKVIKTESDIGLAKPEQKTLKSKGKTSDSVPSTSGTSVAPKKTQKSKVTSEPSLKKIHPTRKPAQKSKNQASNSEPVQGTSKKSAASKKVQSTSDTASGPKKIFPTKKSASNLLLKETSSRKLTEKSSTSNKKASAKTTPKKISDFFKKSEEAYSQKQSPKRRQTSAIKPTKHSGKTGSCASSRRGSERSRQAVGASRTSDTSSQSESGRCLPSNAVLMRRSRQVAGEETRKRAANDCENSGAAARRPAGEASNASGAAAATTSNNDSESDDPDISRFQALLEARGLPPRLFGNLGPRMQQVLHRSIGNNSKVQQYLQGIQAEGDESQQLQSAIGMCQMLVMGNEDTLAGFPIKLAVPALTNLLKMEHNFDLMNHACRALTYMMEALPHSSAIITDAIPIMLDRLQTIQCIDVAEQSLTALEILSRRHASAVLAAGGISSCLQYIEFFSLPAQRAALSIAANCCYAVGTLASNDASGPEEEFEKFMKASLPLLSGRLSHHDKKCVESTCLCFVRLIDSYQQDAKVLNEIASGDLLKNFQNLLVLSPPLLSSGMLVLVLHSMTILCSKLRRLAADVLKENIAETLHYLLCGKPSGEKITSIELLPRGSQEMLEITSFAVQLLPRLPKDDPIFIVKGDTATNGVRTKVATWQWKDESGQWRSYKHHESRMIEMAYSRGEHEFDFHTGDRSISINFEAMRLVDENTGNSQAVQRTVSKEAEVQEIEADDIKHDTKEFGHYVEIIFPVMCEVYNASAGFPPVRHVCLHGIHQMVYFTEPSVQEAILSKISLSSQISSMLSNPDFQIVVGALQLAELVMRKLPKIFKESFMREGVVHRVKNLSQIPIAMETEDETKLDTNSNTRSSRRSQNRSGAVAKKTYSLRTSEEHLSSTKGKSKEQRPSTSSSKASTSSRPSRVTKMASSFFSNLSPSTWGKSISSALSSKDGSSSSGAHSGDRASKKIKDGSGSSKDAVNNETEKWIKHQATDFLSNHFKETQSGNNGEPNILDKLTTVAKNLFDSVDDAEAQLESLRNILDSVEVSPFEMIQSGIISALLKYLTVVEMSEAAERETKIDYVQLDSRVRLFLSVYAGLPKGYRDAAINGFTVTSIQSISNLVRKLNQCVGRLEQFSVKNRELIFGRSNIMRALTTRQLKCQLQRHPDCQSGKRWLGGPIKVDALLQMKAIERFLITKGYGILGATLKQRLSSSLLFHDDDDDDDDVDSDEEDEIHDLGLDVEERDLSTSSSASHPLAPTPDTNASEENSSSGKRKPSSDSQPQRLEFFIDNHKIPRHMTVYQALQMYGNRTQSGSSTPDYDEDPGFSLLSSTSFWSRTHLIHYRLEKRDSSISETKTKSQSKSSKKASKKAREIPKNPLWADGITPVPVNPIHKLLTPQLPPDFCIKDPCSEALCLLRVVHAVSRYWYYMYSPNLIHINRPLVAVSEFINNEINAKCMHQLEDPLVCITGQLSHWVPQIARVCPFLLSFEARQLLFKVTAFDRDRALQHLIDTGAARTFSAHMVMTSNNSHSSSPNPFVPRIEKKKCSVSRKNLLQQAEKIINEHGHSLATIEVDYENEVGTGLGPTLEFFTLTSKELQNSALKLWREELKSEDLTISDEKDGGSRDVEMKNPSSPQEIDVVKSIAGLFPRPLGYNAKQSQVSRVVAKFKFLGKFLAKALLDGRLVDVPLSVACYKWLLGDEISFTGIDLDYVDPVLALTFRKFCTVAHQREEIMSTDPMSIESLEMDGCLIEDLGLDMCLPGYTNVELMKSGKNSAVTAVNLDKYLKLLVHWTLFEGVKHQMSAMREGFESVIPISTLGHFYAEELDQLFCGSRFKPWDAHELSEACHPDHGYTQDSDTVKSLYKILSSYDTTDQRNFLQFVTGCPHLPFGGLKSLNPPLTVVRKTCEGSVNPDVYLPSVMTCLNYLKLPEYSSEDVMRNKLQVAMLEGQKSFLLS